MSLIRLLSIAAAAALLTGSAASYVAYDLTPRPEGEDGARSAFSAEVGGHVTARLTGAAEFGSVPAGMEDSIFSLSLGARDTAGAVVFTRMNGEPLTQGTYVVSDLGEDGDVVRALVITGSPSRPTGAFRGWSGLLTIANASDTAMSGTFEFHAGGFLVRDPQDENRRVCVKGSFTAVRAPARPPATIAGGR